MDRVTDFESGGCAFEPRRGRLTFCNVPLLFIGCPRSHTPALAGGARELRFPQSKKAQFVTVKGITQTERDFSVDVWKKALELV